MELVVLLGASWVPHSSLLAPSILVKYANFLKARGNLDGAEVYFGRALKAEPAHPEALGNYAGVCVCSV